MKRSRFAACLAIVLLGAAFADPRSGLLDSAWADARRARSAHGRTTHHARSHGRSRHRPAPRATHPRVSPAYRRMVASWHAAPPPAVRRAWLAKRPPPLVLRPIGAPHAFTLVPDARGNFGEDALAVAREAFRYGATGAHHEIEPRLLVLCYRAVRRFKAPYVTLVSGYRERKATSRHDQGRAMDIVLPGVSNERLATFLRQQGFVGVGVYPVSGFVHLDVRARSYFWIDRSGPSEPSQTQATLSNLISRFDADARRRGEHPVADVIAAASESDEAAPTPENAPESPRAEREADVAPASDATPAPEVAPPVGAIVP